MSVPGGDEPHHVAAHDALGAALARLGRILELLAHRDAMAERDQPVQIFVGAHDRHAAHRHVLAEILAALGQHDAERARGDLGVLEEHLVEIAHPVEQQAIRIGGLDLDVLRHHRRDAAGVGALPGALIIIGHISVHIIIDGARFAARRSAVIIRDAVIIIERGGVAGLFLLLLLLRRIAPAFAVLRCGGGRLVVRLGARLRQRHGGRLADDPRLRRTGGSI